MNITESFTENTAVGDWFVQTGGGLLFASGVCVREPDELPTHDEN